MLNQLGARAGALAVAAAVAAGTGCNSQPDPLAGVSVTGVPELRGAAVYFDERLAGHLDYLFPPDRLLTRVLKRIYPDSPPLEVVALNIDMSRFIALPSQHVLRVEWPGHSEVRYEFVFPPKEKARWLYLFILSDGAVVVNTDQE